MPVPKIELSMNHYVKIPLVGNISHSFIIYTDENGREFALRANAGGAHTIAEPYGKLTINGAYELVPYDKHHKDWGNYARISLYQGNEAKFKFEAARLFAQDISGKYPYLPTTQNCNWFAFLALEVMGLGDIALASSPLYQCGSKGNELCEPLGFGYNTFNFPQGSIDPQYYQNKAYQNMLNPMRELPAVAECSDIREYLEPEMKTFLEEYGVDETSIPDETKQLIAGNLSEIKKSYMAAHREAAKQQQTLIKRKQFIEACNGIRDSAKVLSYIGTSIDSQSLYKSGALISSVVDIVQNTALLSGFLGPAPVGLAALTPISAVVFATFTIFSLFTKKKSGSTEPFAMVMQQIQMLSQQIEALHLEMREHFFQVYQNQQKIMEAISEGIELLSKQIDRRIDDVIEPTIYQLDLVSDSLQTMYGVIFNQSHIISLQKLDDIIHRVDSLLDKVVVLGAAKKLEQFVIDALKLEGWLTKRAVSSVYNGQICFQPVQSTNSMNQTFAIATINRRTMELSYLNGLIGYLGAQCKAFLLDEFPASIKLNQLINPQIWIATIQPYLRLREYFFAQGIEYDQQEMKLQEIKEVLQNNIAFIQFLQRSNILYQSLLNNLNETFADIHAVTQETVYAGFMPLEESYKKYFETCAFRYSEANFLHASSNLQSRIKPLFDKHQALIKRVIDGKLKLFNDNAKWLTSKIVDKKTIASAITSMRNPVSSIKDALAIEISNRLNVPINTFCFPRADAGYIGFGFENQYTIPICLDSILLQLSIPPIFILAENLGILKFHMQFKWTANQNAFHVGYRTPDDRYLYSITIEIQIGSVKQILYTFDCVGSLTDHAETRDIPQLYNELHSYWYANYNVHYGDGRYKPNAIGYSMTNIYRVVGMITPFMGSSPQLVPGTIQFAQGIDVNALYDELIKQINEGIDKLHLTALTRLTGTANTDWTNLQPAKEKAQAIINHLTAYLQLAGFSSDILKKVQILSEHFLSDELMKYLLPISTNAVIQNALEDKAIPQTINTILWYDDADINYLMETYILARLGGRRPGHSFLLSETFYENGQPYRVAVTPAIDNEGYAQPIIMWLDKLTQQAPDSAYPDNRRDVFDEVSESLLPGSIGKVKIIFPYNIKNSHWLTGEIIIERTAADTIRLELYTHDPIGGGSMLPRNVELITSAIRGRLEQTLLSGSITHVEVLTPISPYIQRQSRGDNTSCGCIAVSDMIKRIQGQSLNTPEPYSVGALALRNEHLELIQQHYSVTDIDRLRFEKNHTLKNKVDNNVLQSQTGYLIEIISSVVELKNTKEFSHYFTSEIEETLQFWLKLITIFQETHQLDNTKISLISSFNTQFHEEFFDDESEDEAFGTELPPDLGSFVIPRKSWTRLKSTEGKSKLLGSGSFGQTYAGQLLDKTTHERHDIAIKSIKAQDLGLESVPLKTAFFKEVKHLSQFHYPVARHVIFFHGITKHRNKTSQEARYSLIMEKAQMSLETLLNEIREGKRPKLTWAEKAQLMLDIAKGLQEIHGKNIVHADIKDSNILMVTKANGEMTAKISDLGISVVRNTATTLGTMLPGQRSGTKLWQAPEVILGKNHHWSSDIFSFGLVIWRILHDGSAFFIDKQGLPFDEVRLRNMYHRNIGYRPTINKDIPLVFQGILQSCWRVNYLESMEISDEGELSFEGTGTQRSTAAEIVQILSGDEVERVALCAHVQSKGGDKERKSSVQFFVPQQAHGNTLPSVEEAGQKRSQVLSTSQEQPPNKRPRID